MKTIRKFLAAFSLYSKIPVPRFEAKEEDIKGCIMFLPIVGAVIAVVMFALMRLLSYFPVLIPAKAAISLLVPLVITGGFHLDGFMDVCDAVSSYRSKEEKLAILKDPHIGSFAVIRLAMAGLFAFAGLLLILNIETREAKPLFVLVCGIFVLSRAMGALTSLVMKKAKDDGLLVKEAEDEGSAPIVFLMITLIAALSFMVYIDVINTGVIMLSFAIYTFIYKRMVTKNFGGVTGDTAGYYITVSTVFAICAFAVSVLAQEWFT
ncbi:MAG: adenosylcobinamide-GDP ribazoletransferase [Lachnospiraceae bacterium]|nr:adenosylcobinamide-GDP ribazoletransferase [Lachnospiraceae bacterium]